MRKAARFALLLLSLATLWGCSHTVVVPVPPRMALQSFGTVGLVDFASNANAAINEQVTVAFEWQIHSAQPGTRIVALGTRESLLGSVDARQLDAQALRRIGEKYGVDAIFLGSLTYAETRTDIKVSDATKLEGGVRFDVRGDISSKLIETRSGASVWSNAAWTRRQLGHLKVSAEQGVSGAMRSSNPREEMVSALVYQLTEDFRPSSMRQAAK